MNPTTGTTGTIGHPDVSEISELTEGLLSPSRTAEVRSHLGDCPLCTDVRASLEEIRSLLGTLPGPARMPADIAGRIDAALAAEALLDATTPHGDAGTTPHGDPGADVPRETSPAPTAPTAPPGGTGALRPSGHPAGPTGPGRRRARRRIALAGGLIAACAAGVLVIGLMSRDRPAQDMSARSDAATAQSRSGAPAYTAEGLPGTVRELLASASRGDKAAGEGEGNNTFGVENNAPTEPSSAPADGGAPRAPACVREATGRTENPLGFEHGTYEGKDVFLLVLPHPGDPAAVDAYLVGSGCVTDPSAAPGKPLLTSTYPKS